MIKIDLEYLQKRSRLLNEMPKASSIWSRMDDGKNKFNQFNTLYSQVRKALMPYGNAQRMGLDYMIKAIYGKNLPGTVNQVATDYANKHPEEYSQWQEHLGKTKGTKYEKHQSMPRKEFLLTDLVKKNINKILKPEFVEMLLSKESLENFANTPGGTDASVNSFTAAHAKRDKEETHGVDLNQYYQQKSGGNELVKQINKLTRQLKSGKASISTEDDGALSPDVYYADAISEELSQIAKYIGNGGAEDGGIWGKSKSSNPSTPDEWRAYFGKELSEEDYNVIDNFIETRITGGQGLTHETMLKVASNLGKKSPVLKQLGEYLANVASESEEYDSYESRDYPGYDERALDKILNTDEKRDAFANWYSIDKVEKEKRNTQDLNKALNQFQSYARGREDGSSVKTVEDQIADLYALAGQADNQKEIQRIKKKIETLQNQPQSPDEEEEGVMGYMTEQVAREALYHPKGEFVDRGFKKFKNYDHWLSHNNQF